MKPSLANLSAVSAAILLSATFAFAGGGEDQAVLKSETSTYQCDILNERGVSVLSEGPAVITESVNLWKAGVNSVSVTLNEKSVIAELKSANAADKDASGIGVLVSVSTDRNSPLTWIFAHSKLN